MDINDTPIDELLAGLSPSAPRPQQQLAKWLAAEGYHPGSTRVQAGELYDRYVRWWLQHNDSTAQVPTMTSWGIEMSRRFKKGRGQHGVFYYISRESVVEIPPSLANGGGGNVGGSTPGGVG